jgi:hypothetical protein
MTLTVFTHVFGDRILIMDIDWSLYEDRSIVKALLDGSKFRGPRLRHKWLAQIGALSAIRYDSRDSETSSSGMA